MQKQKIFEFTHSGISIGATIDTPPLYYVTVYDLNKEQIRVPYRDPQISIGKLIQNYREITNCKDLYKKQPCFIILQGYFAGSPALDKFKLSSLNLRLDRPAFRVADGNQITQQSHLLTHSKLAQSQREGKIGLRIRYNEQIFQTSINRNELISTLKKELIGKHQLALTLDMLRFTFEDTVLLNTNKISYYKGLTNNSQITAVILKSEGCFRSNTIVTLPNKKSPISSLEIGDKVLSFNPANNCYEEDEITWIHKSTLAEYIVLTLQDETIIQTTANHTFLCNDGKYRKAQYDRRHQSMKVGTVLKRCNMKDCAIKQIESKTLFPPQQFYHLLVKNNHNFIVNDAVAHNMFIKINYIDKHEENMNVAQACSVFSIKKQLSQRYQLHSAHSMRVTSNGLDLNSHSNLSDYNVKKESKLTVIIKQEQQYGYLHPETKVKLQNNVYKMAKDIGKGDKVSFYSNHKQTQLSLTENILTKGVAQFYKITLESKQQIKLIADSYLENETGEAKIVYQLFESLKKQKEKPLFLRQIDGKIKIIKIQKIKKSLPQLYRIQHKQQSSLILQPNVILHNKVVTLLCEFQNSRHELCYGVTALTKISQIKQKIAQKFQINKNRLHFYYEDIQLRNETTFEQHRIPIGAFVIVDEAADRQSRIFASERFENEQKNMIELQVSSSEKYQLEYSKFANRTVQQIMKYLIPYYKSSYFFLFAEKIILPTQTLNEIQKSPQFNRSATNTVIVVKNQKLAFVMNMDLKGPQVYNISYIIPATMSSISLIQIEPENQVQNSQSYIKASERIQSNLKLDQLYRRPIFYKPFLYFFNPQFRSQMRKYLINFESHLLNNTKGQIFKIVKSLYINMIYLPNYITKPLEETYFGVRNFKFASFFNKNDTFYLYQYLLTNNDEQAIRNQLNHQNGTLFRLISTTGKNIINFSINPPKKIQKNKNGNEVTSDYVELLFPPYTYFLVNKIVRRDDFDQVWISQISSPITLRKDIVLWVDDVPKNNEQGIKMMLKNKDIQILPLLSTQQAYKWLKQFGWLMTWKGINFKLISDMGRLQYKQDKEEQVQDFEAGFELVNKIYNQYGLTVKTYIFCGDKTKTQNLLLTNPKFQSLREKYNEHFKITADGKQIIKFCCEDSWP